MKNTLLSLALLIIAGLTLNSCQTDDDNPDQKLSKTSPLTALLMRVSHDGITVGRDGENEDENDDDDENEDIDCVNIAYPINFTLNDVNGNTTSVDLNNDADLYAFLSELEDNETMNINYPVSITTIEGQTVTVTNNEQFEDAIEDCGNIDDEDDDDDDDEDEDDDENEDDDEDEDEDDNDDDDNDNGR